MTVLAQEIHEIESAIHELHAGDSNLYDVRRKMCQSLQRLAGLDPDSSASLPTIFEEVAGNCRSGRVNEIGSISIRLIDHRDILSEDDIRKCGRYIVQIIENAPDLAPSEPQQRTQRKRADTKKTKIWKERFMGSGIR